MLISSFKRYLRFYRPNSFRDTAIFIIKDKYYTVLDIGSLDICTVITSLLPVGNDFHLGGGEEKKKKRKVYMVQYCSIFARKYAPGRR